uniref:Uncharacterized protein n=1 Tax=Magallana gigas TaxID=29159 RepID=K1R5F6_MAGGI
MVRLRSRLSRGAKQAEHVAILLTATAPPPHNQHIHEGLRISGGGSKKPKKTSLEHRCSAW